MDKRSVNGKFSGPAVRSFHGLHGYLMVKELDHCHEMENQHVGCAKMIVFYTRRCRKQMEKEVDNMSDLNRIRLTETVHGAG